MFTGALQTIEIKLGAAGVLPWTAEAVDTALVVTPTNGVTNGVTAVTVVAASKGFLKSFLLRNNDSVVHALTIQLNDNGTVRPVIVATLSIGDMIIYDATNGWRFYDSTGKLKVQSAEGGGGDVVGPASAVDNRIAVYDGVTGKLLKDGGVAVSGLLANSANTVDLDNLKTECKYVQANFVFPSTFMTGRAAGEDLIEKVIKQIFKWELPNAKLRGFKAIALTDDSGAAVATINIEINGSEALSAAVNVAETEQTGTINTGADTVTTGQRVEITVVTTGTTKDSADLTVRTLWEVLG